MTLKRGDERTMLPGLSTTMNCRSLSSCSTLTGVEVTGGSCRCTTFLDTEMVYKTWRIPRQIDNALNKISVYDDSLRICYVSINRGYTRF